MKFFPYHETVHEFGVSVRDWEEFVAGLGVESDAAFFRIMTESRVGSHLATLKALTSITDIA